MTIKSYSSCNDSMFHLLCLCSDDDVKILCVMLSGTKQFLGGDVKSNI